MIDTEKTEELQEQWQRFANELKQQNKKLEYIDLFTMWTITKFAELENRLPKPKKEPVYQSPFTQLILALQDHEFSYSNITQEIIEFIYEFQPAVQIDSDLKYQKLEQDFSDYKQTFKNK